MQHKLTLLAVFGITLLIGGAIMFSDGSKNQTGDYTSGEVDQVGNAIIENGIQYVDITARGGYSPKTTKARANMPTVIRMKTENSYDCSTALVIPDIKYQKYLPRTGVENIEIPLENTQGTLLGMCSMAMYHFQIEFE